MNFLLLLLQVSDLDVSSRLRFALVDSATSRRFVCPFRFELEAGERDNTVRNATVKFFQIRALRRQNTDPERPVVTRRSSMCQLNLTVYDEANRSDTATLRLFALGKSERVKLVFASSSSSHSSLPSPLSLADLGSAIETDIDRLIGLNSHVDRLFAAAAASKGNHTSSSRASERVITTAFMHFVSGKRDDDDDDDEMMPADRVVQLLDQAVERQQQRVFVNVAGKRHQRLIGIEWNDGDGNNQQLHKLSYLSDDDDDDDDDAKEKNQEQQQQQQQLLLDAAPPQRAVSSSSVLTTSVRGLVAALVVVALLLAFPLLAVLVACLSMRRKYARKLRTERAMMKAFGSCAGGGGGTHSPPGSSYMLATGVHSMQPDRHRRQQQQQQQPQYTHQHEHNQQQQQQLIQVPTFTAGYVNMAFEPTALPPPPPPPPKPMHKIANFNQLPLSLPPPPLPHSAVLCSQFNPSSKRQQQQQTDTSTGYAHVVSQSSSSSAASSSSRSSAESSSLPSPSTSTSSASRANNNNNNNNKQNSGDASSETTQTFYLKHVDTTPAAANNHNSSLLTFVACGQKQPTMPRTNAQHLRSSAASPGNASASYLCPTSSSSSSSSTAAGDAPTNASYTKIFDNGDATNACDENTGGGVANRTNDHTRKTDYSDLYAVESTVI